MTDNLHVNAIKVFVFGTLRNGGYLDYYMDGGLFSGMYYTRGQLMMSELGAAYIDFNEDQAATIGELYYMNYPGLLRIDHLESRSGEFPKGYDLDIIPIWKMREDKRFTFSESEKSIAFFYRRRNDPVKILNGDWNSRTKPVQEIGDFMKKDNSRPVEAEDLIQHMIKYLENK
jgi:gamma-glutamylcyclotransferase (GGCT)/AIG2-like uncharacterized protein YtfP